MLVLDIHSQGNIREHIAHLQAKLGDMTEPLASIASQCGFSSQAHFGNRFREAFGLTPGQWRAQLSSSRHR